VARTQPDGSLQKMVVNSTREDVLLHPNDIVMVTNTLTSTRINTVFGLIAKIMAPVVKGRSYYVTSTRCGLSTAMALVCKPVFNTTAPYPSRSSRES
jgi:hypothetical protein